MLYNAATINPTTELVFSFIEALRADPQWKKGQCLYSHTQCEFQPERHFDHFTDDMEKRTRKNIICANKTKGNLPNLIMQLK